MRDAKSKALRDFVALHKKKPAPKYAKVPGLVYHRMAERMNRGEKII